MQTTLTHLPFTVKELYFLQQGLLPKQANAAKCELNASVSETINAYITKPAAIVRQCGQAQHWQYVGGSAIASGRHVRSVTWQRNRGFARHT